MLQMLRQNIGTGMVALVLALGLSLAPSPAVQAQCTGAECFRDGAETAQTAEQDTNLKDSVKNLTNVLLFVLAAISVIMIIFGGIRFATSNGNADQIKSAKNVIMYSVIGLVVAILAYAIVDFVVDALVAIPDGGPSRLV